MAVWCDLRNVSLLLCWVVKAQCGVGKLLLNKTKFFWSCKTPHWAFVLQFLNAEVANR